MGVHFRTCVVAANPSDFAIALVNPNAKLQTRSGVEA